MAIVVYIPLSLNSYNNGLDLSFRREFADDAALVEAFATYKGEELRNLEASQIQGASEHYTVGQALMDLETYFGEQPQMLEKLFNGWVRYHEEMRLLSNQESLEARQTEQDLGVDAPYF